MRELIRVAKDLSLGFGDYTLSEKTKLSDFEFEGDIYKVKTFKDLTRLEKNDMFMYESEPGTSVEGLIVKDNVLNFMVEGDGSTQITLGLEDDSEYDVSVNGNDFGKMVTNMGGKLVLSAELEKNKPQMIIVKKL